MWFKKCVLITLTYLALLAIQACNDEDTPKPKICNCDATGTESFQSVQAIVVNTTEGFFVLSPFTGYFKPCEVLNKNLEVDGLMITISGTTKATCDKPDDIFKQEKQSYSIITSTLVATDSLFSAEPFKIKIIKSEDYGYSQGYGYRITHNSGLKILQATIPAIGGNQPFKTSTDAFKTAVLVSYKLNLGVGLPSLTIQDLRFLQVLY